MKFVKIAVILLLVLSCCEAAKKKKKKKDPEPERNCTLVLREHLEKNIKKNKAWKKCDKSNKLMKECVADYEYKPEKVADEYEDLLICRYLASEQFQDDWWEDTKTERKAIIKAYKKTDDYKAELDVYVPGAIMAVVEALLEIKFEELEIELSRNYTEKYETAKVRLESFMESLADSVGSYIINLKEAIQVLPYATDMTPTSNSFHWLTRTEWTPSEGAATTMNTYSDTQPSVSTSASASVSEALPTTKPYVIDPRTYIFRDEDGDGLDDDKVEGPDDLVQCAPETYTNILTSMRLDEKENKDLRGDSQKEKVGWSRWIGVEGIKNLAYNPLSGVRLTTTDCETGLVNYKYWSHLHYNETKQVIYLRSSEGDTQWTESLEVNLAVDIRCEGEDWQSADQPMECKTGFITFDRHSDALEMNCKRVWLVNDLVSEMSLDAFNVTDCSQTEDNLETVLDPVVEDEKFEETIISDAIMID